MSSAPAFTTSYQWRTASSGTFTTKHLCCRHTYVETKPYTAPTSYTVAYHPGANGTGSEAIDAKTIDVVRVPLSSYC